MGETEQELRTNLDGTRSEVDSLDPRRTYETPEVTVLEFRAIIKSGSGRGQDGSGFPQTRP